MGKPPLRIDAVNGTTFVLEAGAVEIVRQDQPICTVPFADVAEFIRQSQEAEKTKALCESASLLSGEEARQLA
jgi:hypothetical protein